MSKSQLPANIANMATGLAASLADAKASVSGDLYMKMTKEGIFVYGAEEVEVEDNSIWVINPGGFQHGWTAWGDEAHGTEGKNLGEKMCNAATAIFPEADLPPVEGSWSKAIGIHLACTTGEDEGVNCLFKSNSFGGRKAYATILEAVVRRINDGDAEIVPKVKLTNTSYKHQKYGKIYNPVFEIVGWTTMDAVDAVEEEPEDLDEEEQEETPEPPRRRRGSKQKEEEPPFDTGETLEGEAEEVDDEDEEEEEEKPRRRRRRRSS